MENLEKYIQENIEQFNTGEMPAGHRERFMAKLEALNTQERKAAKPHRLFSRRSIFTASAAAAAIIIALLATPNSGEQPENQYSIAIQELAQEMYMEEAETLMLFGEDEQYMINNVKSITNEAIPLTEQLPDELSPERRAEILREYYKAKTAALKKIRTLYAQSEEPID